MPKPKSYKQMTIELTGMSSAEYDRQFKYYRRQVANYNRATGQSYKAAKSFYNSKLYAGSEFSYLREISMTPKTAKTTGLTARERSVGVQFLKNQYRTLMNSNQKVKSMIELAENGEINPATANTNIKGYLERIKVQSSRGGLLNPADYRKLKYNIDVDDDEYDE